MALNGGIRWLALNGEAVNGKEDMRGQNHSRGGTFDFGGRKHYFDIRDCIFLVWSLVDCHKGASVAGSFGLGGQES